MRKFTFFLSIVLISVCFGWQYWRDLGGGLDDGRDIDLCADGGFFITGRSNGWALGGFAENWYDHEFFLIKLDSLGNEEWVRHYGESGEGYYDAAWSVCATSDSGCVMCGKTQSPRWTDPPPGYLTYYDNVLAIRVDKIGDTLWTRTFGGERFDRAWWIKDIPGTGDFFMAGPCASYGLDMPSVDYENIWIMRIDSAGSLVANSLWEDSTRDGHTDVRWGALTPEGGCIVVGSTDLRDTSHYYAPYDSVVTHRISRAVVIKTDSLCNVLWSKIYDTGCSDHYSRSITSCVDGGYLMTTYNKWPAWTWCLRLDEEGDTLWTRYIGLDLFDPETRLANFTMVVNDGGSGFYFAGSGQGWAWIIRTDSELNERWRIPASFGSASDLFLSCVRTPDGGVCACGQTYSAPPTAYSDIFAMRLDRFGNDYSGIEESAAKRPTAPAIKAFPNPFNSSVTISISGEVPANMRMEIYDIGGRLIDEMPFPGTSSLRWEPDKSIPSGMYLIKGVSDGRSISVAVVFLK